MAKLMLALMELNVSLYDFFEGAVYEQLVKSKTKKQNNVEIINAKDFYSLLHQRGVRKSDNSHDNLTKFLSLDPNYPQLLTMKKVARTLDEMAKNEELMAGIMAATQDDMGAEGMDMEGGEGMDGDDDYEQDGNEPRGGQDRLNTIGEEDQDE